MNNSLIYFDWQYIGNIILGVLLLSALVIFKMNSSISEKILKVGIGFFITSLIINIVGFTTISDFLSSVGFIIISISLVKLLWSDRRK